MFLQQLTDDPRFFFSVIITVVVSICVHELAHGVAAIWLGDRTPIESGHMTFNPIVHMGGMSLIMLILTGISWGAMPINPSRLRGKYGGAIVALAGPFSNLLMAAIALTIVALWRRFSHPPAGSESDAVHNVQYLLLIFGTVNLSLLFFNLIPVPPLDGSRALAYFSNSYARLMWNLQQNGQSAIGLIVVFIFIGPKLSHFANVLGIEYFKLIRGW